MQSKREQVLDALLTAVKRVYGPEIQRGGDLPTRIPPGGLLTLRDGEPGEPEVSLSPLVYEYRHRAEIEIILQPSVNDDPDRALDNVLMALGEALDRDRTLGGLCLWVEPEAPVTSDLALEGTAGIIAAIVPVELTYLTTGPLA